MFKLKGVKKVNARVNITTSHGMGDSKRKADDDTGNSRKKSSVAVEQPQATTERFYFVLTAFEVDMLSCTLRWFEFEVHEGHASALWVAHHVDFRRWPHGQIFRKRSVAGDVGVDC